MTDTCCNAAMSPLGQKWPNTNRSLGPRRSTEMNGRELPTTEVIREPQMALLIPLSIRS
jgi:hypothetical protein